MKMKIILINLITVIFLTACIPATSRQNDDPTIESGKEVIVQAKSTYENIRSLPNGRKIGQVRNGERLKVSKRVGNWIEIYSKRHKRGYIWGPSIGYAYQNLYSPSFYFNKKKKRFKPVSYFQKMFSQKGKRRQETNSVYELSFENIGLGSHEAVVMEIATSTKEIVQHSITFFVDKQSNQIQKLRIDFLKSLNGYHKALKTSGLPIQKPTEKTGGHLTWKEGTLIDHLVVDLERREWDSRWYSGIWYMLPK